MWWDSKADYQGIGGSIAVCVSVGMGGCELWWLWARARWWSGKRGKQRERILVHFHVENGTWIGYPNNAIWVSAVFPSGLECVWWETGSGWWWLVVKGGTFSLL
jgi:hypothetical protein